MDEEYNHTEVQHQNAERPESHRRTWINYTVIALLNFGEFCLTTYGRHKLTTDYGHVDESFSNWDALKLCLAASILTWFAILYGIIRIKKRTVVASVASKKKWDLVYVNIAIWLIWAAAAAFQTAFVNDYFHCVEICRALNAGSVHRNIAYMVFAWLLLVAWTPELIRSAEYSRRLAYTG